MKKEELISLCLQLGGCYIDYPFDDVWAAIRHRESRKTFAFIYEHKGNLCANLKCEPMEGEFLRSVYSGVIPAYHMNKTHWNTVLLDSDVPLQELKEMVNKSYKLTKPTRKRKKSGESAAMSQQTSNGTVWELETNRLSFRRMQENDLAALRPILGDAQTMYAWEYGFKDEQIAEWIERAKERYQSGGCSYFAAIEKESGALIGLMGILPQEINGERFWGLGYIIARKYWGMGYATEGASAWMQYAFEKLGTEQVIAEIRPENTASRKVAEGLGMKIVGEFTKHHHGKEMPHLIYSKQNKIERN